MSELTIMAEYIHEAMLAVEKAHEAGIVLRNNTSEDTLDAFRAQMAELTDHLSKLQNILNNEEAVALDELADALSRIFTGHRADYRRTPRMSE
jgi:hypothetical protein